MYYVGRLVSFGSVVAEMTPTEKEKQSQSDDIVGGGIGFLPPNPRQNDIPIMKTRT